VTAEELKAEVEIEFNLLQQVVDELEALRRDAAGREPSVREKTAAAAFLAQFYSGVENILKRLSRFHDVALPVGDNWHFELFNRFCAAGRTVLPRLFDETLERQFGAFRRFRHVVHHGYGFQIEWSRMQEGLDQVSAILVAFRSRVAAHLDAL
jgi:hypothetical protein